MTFVKSSSGIPSKLDSKLKHGGKTRPWRSVTNMLQSIQKNLSTNSDDNILVKELNTRRRSSLIEAIDVDLLDSFLAVLIQFICLFDQLEASKNLP